MKKKKFVFTVEEKLYDEIIEFAEENCLDKSKLNAWLWRQHLSEVKK